MITKFLDAFEKCYDIAIFTRNSSLWVIQVGSRKYVVNLWCHWSRIRRNDYMYIYFRKWVFQSLLIFNFITTPIWKYFRYWFRFLSNSKVNFDLYSDKFRYYTLVSWMKEIFLIENYEWLLFITNYFRLVLAVYHHKQNLIYAKKRMIMTLYVSIIHEFPQGLFHLRIDTKSVLIYVWNDTFHGNISQSFRWHNQG